jgi:Uma2 family endonuclease
MTWDEIVAHPSLQDLPFKIETNAWGQIVMSPASNQHSRRQFRIAHFFEDALGGEGLVECSIDTPRGVKVADAAWLSDDFLAEHGTTTPYPVAPPICVEVLSPSNTEAEIEEKITLYLAKGAQEVWTCDAEGHLAVHGHAGRLDASRLIPDAPAQID